MVKRTKRKTQKLDPDYNWSPEGRKWCYSSGLRAIFFLDECVTSKADQAFFLDVPPVIKTLIFPQVLRGRGYRDDQVLDSIYHFITFHPVLLKNKIEFYFITRDGKFEQDGGYECFSLKHKIKINFVHLVCVKKSKKDQCRKLIKKIIRDA